MELSIDQTGESNVDRDLKAYAKLLTCENEQSVGDNKDGGADALLISGNRCYIEKSWRRELRAELDNVLAEESKISAGLNFGSTPAKRQRNQHVWNRYRLSIL